MRTAAPPTWATRIPWTLAGVVEGALWALAVGFAAMPLFWILGWAPMFPILAPIAGVLPGGIHAALEPTMDWRARGRRTALAAGAAVAGFVLVMLILRLLVVLA